MHSGAGVSQSPVIQSHQYQQPQQLMIPPRQQQQQQQLMWNRQQFELQQQPPQPTNPNEVRTLWIGDLLFWMDENYVFQCFAQTSAVANVKLIRNKQTSQPEGYGFIEFVTRDAAERALQTFNGTLMPNVEQNFRLNWASPGERRNDDAPEYTIFVGDLASDVTDFALQETFRQHYASVKGAKVVIDKLTGRGKGYGFVKFGDESEQQRAMTEMNGQMCSSRPMRIGAAASKSSLNGQQFPKVSYQNGQGNPNKSDPSNMTQNSSPGAAQPPANSNGWNNRHYGCGNGYQAYGYAPPATQDPNMYFSVGYSPYGNYQQPPQQQQ